MLPVKQNQPSNRQDKTRRFYNDPDTVKTQQHVIEERQYITEQLPQKTSNVRTFSKKTTQKQ